MKSSTKTKVKKNLDTSNDDISSEEPVIKKKKSVKFNSVVDAKTKEAPKAAKKFQSSITTEVEEPTPTANEEAPVEVSRARKRKMKRKESLKRKHQKMVDSILGPQVDTVEFAPDQKKFADFDLDERILKGIGEMGWEHPTQVQESVIALALENKNIMARARTGSGKTAAFLLPTLQKVLQHLLASPDSTGPFVLYIAPTKELANQIFRLLSTFLHPLPFLQALNLSELSEAEKTVWEQDTPALVVSTPGKMMEMVTMRPEFCKNVRHLVLDEADLLLSFGYESEMTNLKKHLPAEYQCILTSATLRDDMTFLKKVFMTGPVVTIKLKEADLPDGDQLAQYHITCLDDEQRFTIMVSMLKLKLIVGKTIIFVNTIDRGFKLSLVLRTLGVKSCILNSEMPANTRCHSIEQFNSGLFDVIIASDTYDTIVHRETLAEGAADTSESNAKSEKLGRRDKESGVARGIDFHRVANVVNFDFPTTTEVYIHRVGRTARGWNKGTALSFCAPNERSYLEKIQEDINTQLGRKVLMPYEIRIKELDSFLLRTREALRKCSKSVIKQARMREIKLEMMRSAQLKGYFAANPREKDLMNTNGQHVALKVHAEGIADVVDYMVPKALRGMDFSVEKKKKFKKKNAAGGFGKMTHNQKRYQKTRSDPLRTFKVTTKAKPAAK